jgi:hypothetical protein
MTFNSEGKSPDEIFSLMESLGFKTTRGQHDFAYDWGKKEPTIEEIKALIQRLHNKLMGCKVLYRVTTI